MINFIYLIDLYRLFIFCGLLAGLGFPSWGYSLSLIDGKNFFYDFASDGALQRGTLGAYAGMYHLRVNGANYVGAISSLSPDGREVRREVFVEPKTGLEIRRHCYVAKMSQFARFSEILSNPTDTPITVEVEIFGNLGARQQAVSQQQHFLITDDIIDGVSGHLPVLLHYHSQVNSPVIAQVSLNDKQLSWTYSSVTIPAQSQRRLLYFVAQTTNLDAAREIATFIYNNSTALYENLGAVPLTELLNFQAPQPIARDGKPTDFSKAPFLKTGEIRTGQLVASDAWSKRRVAVPADGYALNLAANESVTIEMSALFNAYLYLFQDVKGEQLLLANDDQSADTTNAQLVFTAPQAGSYYLEATAYQRHEQGPYTLTIFANALNQPPHAHTFAITPTPLTAPASVTFTDFSQDLDGDIVERCWHFDDGTPLTCDTGATMTHDYESAGQYQVGLTVRDNDGAYAYVHAQVIIRWEAPGPGVVISLANTITGELAASDPRSQIRANAYTDRYQIASVTAGQTLIVDMRSEQFDSYLYLYDEFYQLLQAHDNGGISNSKNARLRYTPRENSPLFIEATSFTDNTLGNYTLSLQSANNSVTLPLRIEYTPTVTNPLQNILIARLPASFNASVIQWNFGDGSPVKITSAAVISHTYPETGDFTVTVVATNAHNEQLNGEQMVTVYAQLMAPSVQFQASPLFGENPLRVFFQNESLPHTLNSDLTRAGLRYSWQFADGQISSALNPAHTFLYGGTYHVTLQATDPTTQQRASMTMPITVIDRQNGEIPIIGTVRERPQVLMGGFDPMLIDVLDTQLKVFAIVRRGKTPLQTVRLIANGSDFGWVMQRMATYGNGDQRYETVINFLPGTFAVGSLTNLLGSQSGQFQIQAIDQAGQFHAFPNLEMGNNPPLLSGQKSLNLKPQPLTADRRSQPQVLAAGFDPALVHVGETTANLTGKNDGQFTIKAIVREGMFPIQQVILEQNQTELKLPLRWIETFSNGDKLYAVYYTYPSNSLNNNTLGDLFGVQAGQFKITVIDSMRQSHSFPEVKIGNFRAH